MKKIFFLIIFVCSTANAQWVGIMHKDRKVEYMLDVKLMSRYGSNFLIPTLLNYKEVQIGADGQPFFSELANVEYDCEQKRTRQHFIKRYGDNLGGGVMVSKFDSKSDWKNFTDGAHAEVLQNTICRK
jgi:hypothetical protein